MANEEEREEQQQQPKKAEIRHTITAEETFTLAKDIYDIRCFVKNVYNNRAVIKRRLNLFSLSASIFFTVIYLAYLVYASLTKNLNFGVGIALYALLGVYGVLVILLLVVTAGYGGAKSGSVHRLAQVLQIFRLSVRIMSVIISLVAIILNFSDIVTTSSIAFNVVIVIFSILTLIIQLVLLIAGGIAGFVRWLLSPVKIKQKLSYVALEWYELASADEKKGGKKSDKSDNKHNVNRVAEKYIDDIGRCIDVYINPDLGKKYISTIKPVAILNVVENAPEEDKVLVGGTFKSIFKYAEECGYVNINPCRNLELGSIEEEIRERKTFKQRLFGLGTRYAKRKLNQFIEESVATEDED